MDITVSNPGRRVLNSLMGVFATCATLALVVYGIVGTDTGNFPDSNAAMASVSAGRPLDPGMRTVAWDGSSTSLEARRVASADTVDNSRECDSEKGITERCVY
jgi:hypothetical protein